MNESSDLQKSDQQIMAGAEGYTKLGRRWCAILAGMLVSNSLLIVLAVASYENSESPVELSELAMATAASAAAKQPSPVAVQSPQDIGNGEETPRTDADLVDDVATSAGTNSGVYRSQSVQQPAAENDAQSSPHAVAAVTTESSNQEQRTSLAEHPVTRHTTSVTNQIARRETKPLVAPVELEGLLLINPPTTGGIVHYMVDGKACCLRPAEFHRVVGIHKKKIAFHRGDDFSDAEQVIGEGLFMFGVTEHGWVLNPIGREDGPALLELCRIAAPDRQ